MTQAKLTAGDAVGETVLTGGNDGTLVVEVGAAGSKVNAIRIGATGQVSLPQNTTNKLVAASGSAPVYGVRAWCIFDGNTGGTNAPTAGGNVATVTRNPGGGNYTVTFITPMAGISYSVVVTAGVAAGTGQRVCTADSKTPTSFRILTENLSGVVSDSGLVNVVVVE